MNNDTREHRPFSPVDPEERARLRAEVMRRHHAGETNDEIADAFGVHNGTIAYHVERGLAREQGKPLDGDQRQKRNARRDADIVKRAARGETHESIGHVHGISRQAVGLVVSRHRDKQRERGEDPYGRSGPKIEGEEEFIQGVRRLLRATFGH